MCEGACGAGSATVVHVYYAAMISMRASCYRDKSLIIIHAVQETPLRANRESAPWIPVGHDEGGGTPLLLTKREEECHADAAAVSEAAAVGKLRQRSHNMQLVKTGQVI